MSTTTPVEQCNYCGLSLNSTYCKYQEFSKSCPEIISFGVTEEDKIEILENHNAYRRQVAKGMEPRLAALPAADMAELQWDAELAQGAQMWANQCKWDHDEYRRVCRFPVGQNLHIYANYKIEWNWTRGIRGWYQEVSTFSRQVTNFNYGRDYSALHFTQVVWAKTRYIGCGKIAYRGYKTYDRLNSAFYVCNYGEAGNVQGRPVYQIGQPCSKCPQGSTCSDGLCSFSSSINNEGNIASEENKEEFKPTNEEQQEKQPENQHTVKLESKCNYCDLHPRNTYCLYNGVGNRCSEILSSGVSAEQKKLIVETHNFLRGRVANGSEPHLAGYPAADMIQLQWDEELALGAQLWANQCQFKHDKERGVCRFRVGQNLYIAGSMGIPSYDWPKAIKAWYDEVVVFNGDVSRYFFSSVTGHFSQIVWARTRYIGCGAISYTGYNGDGRFNTAYYVCNYGEAGNFQGRPIYTKGPACSRCPQGYTCSGGLCKFPSGRSKISRKYTNTTQSNQISQQPTNKEQESSRQTENFWDTPLSAESSLLL